jgi:tRNA A-37 threonylcarbamoyl transferase component Bud32
MITGDAARPRKRKCVSVTQVCNLPYRRFSIFSIGGPPPARSHPGPGRAPLRLQTGQIQNLSRMLRNFSVSSAGHALKKSCNLTSSASQAWDKMKTGDSENTCPQCGRPIPEEAPQGLCPKCVLAGAATSADADPPASAGSDIPPIERVAAAFPHLEIIELIGRGGMGFVFKARQPGLDRFIALKLLPEKLAKDPRFAERFNREGRVLARLSHPNIVTVYDFGHSDHFYYLMMEHVDGVNLRQAMQAGRFSPKEALSIVPKICEALQFAHEQQVLHRDIKPENILLDTSGRVKIADFGIAKHHVTRTRHCGAGVPDCQ